MPTLLQLHSRTSCCTRSHGDPHSGGTKPPGAPDSGPGRGRCSSFTCRRRRAGGRTAQRQLRTREGKRPRSTGRGACSKARCPRASLRRACQSQRTLTFPLSTGHRERRVQPEKAFSWEMLDTLVFVLSHRPANELQVMVPFSPIHSAGKKPPRLDLWTVRDISIWGLAWGAP